MNESFDPRAWVIWLAAMACLTLFTRNPFYLLLLFLLTQAVAATCARSQTGFRFSLWRFGPIVLLLSTLFNMLSTHSGQTILFSLPAHWPLLGGRVTLEAAVYGAINGLLLLTLLALFMAFNQIVPVGDLVRLTPRALHDLGLVVLIAVTYVPETLQQLQRIREAQAIRGHRLRGLRDWRPIVIPLLVGGLERAMNLAEAMVARGYGATAEVRQPLFIRLGLVAGLVLGLAGWLLTFWLRLVGWLLLGLGLLLLLGIFWQLGQRVRHTRYRTQVWTWRESVMVATAVAPLLLLLIPWPFLPGEILFYNPYPSLTPPPFNPFAGAALALLVTPALV